MFESIVSKVTNILRSVVRTLGATFERSPWIVAVGFLAVLCFA
jgi:hypothetical protein